MVRKKWKENFERWKNGIFSAGSSENPCKRAKNLSTSHLVDWICEEIYWERLSWPKAQSCAHAGLLDGLVDEHLLELASMGSFGHHDQNVSRDSKLLSVLDEASGKAPPAYEFEAPCSSKKAPQETFKVQSGAILLQDYLACMEEHWPAHFEAAWGVQKEKVKEFWSKCNLQDPKFYNHPMLEVPNWQERFFPFFVHADGGKFSERDSLMVTSSSPVLGRGETRDMKLLNWAWPYTAEAKGSYEGEEGSIEEHWLVTCWDMQCVFEGKRPFLDHRNRPFKGNQAWRKKVAGQFILKSEMGGACWGILGDLEFDWKILGMVHWGAAGEGGMCNFCPANNFPLEHPLSMPWTDFRKSALCKALVYLAENWAAIPPSSHPIWQVPGITRFFIMLDSLHINEQKGVASHCVANCLVTI